VEKQSFRARWLRRQIAQFMRIIHEIEALFFAIPGVKNVLLAAAGKAHCKGFRSCSKRRAPGRKTSFPLRFAPASLAT
jgi:hypothetical protein